MVKIEYDKVTIDVPESWDDLTLGFYETFYTEMPETPRDRAVLVAKICKIDAELLLSWPVEVFNRIVGYVDFLFNDNPAPPSPVIDAGGVKYIVPIEDELSLGAWVDADEVQKTGENVLSNILAIVCRPAGEAYAYKNNESRREMFAALPVSKVLPVLAFFLHYKNVFDRRTAAYTKLAQVFDQLPRSIKLFRSLGGGIRLSRIWRLIKYLALMQLLYYRLRKFSRTCNTAKIRTTRKRHNVS